MHAQKETTKSIVISTRTGVETQRLIDEAGELRGHTRSEALAAIIKLGLPLYLKTFRKKYQRIKKSQRVEIHRAVLNGDSSSVR